MPVSPIKVSFQSSGLALAGNLHLPENYNSGEQLPAIVTVTPWGGIKEQTAGNYARRLSEQGFVTLAFDHRSYGESEGSPRFDEDPFNKVEDIKSAVTFLTGRPEVDPERIGIVGVCAGGGYAPYAAATDHRIKAVATVSGVAHLSDFIRDILGVDGLSAALDAAGNARNAYARGEQPAYGTVFPFPKIEGTPPFVYEAPDYYLDPNRGADPEYAKRWENKTLAWSIEKTAVFSALPVVDLISPRPLLLIAGTAADTRTHSELAYEAAGEPKELFWIEGATHIDLYDKPEYAGPATEKFTEFFRKCL